MKLGYIDRLIFSFILLILSACSSREILPEYQQGDKLLSNEAIGVFRVVNAKDDGGFWDMLMEAPVFVDIQKFKTNKWIELRSSGFLDDADSSKIYAVRMPSGLYHIKYARHVHGNIGYEWTFNNNCFFVLPKEVVYIGDIVLSRDREDAWFFNNSVAVRRQLKEQYPELADKLVWRKIYNIKELFKLIKKIKEENTDKNK